ncbi:hypothetical protein B0H15DRAFT_146806 [Mycena belliarum]|uniref:Yeast cell wall synthesis Kre9/Knh1-like N-terminal domain-containing protein n=1 Tax=Mycena belliarum TaxID=1033014 RepID=A0AAD6U981_9AGAR|nr:hypothetical protein B0H15DRAFT_146806 [Mycena belliae]
MFSTSSVFVTLALASSAFAGVFFTSPTAAIGFTAGQPATISWQEDNTPPLLKDFGLAKASIYAGNSAQQTSLQLISASIDVSNPLSLTFTPDATIGPNANQYFIRFESLSLKDAANPAIPALAFSHVFQLSGMTGVFNAEVQAQIDGQSTAPIGGTAAASKAAAATSVAAKTTSAAAANTNKSVAGSASKSAKAAVASGSSAAVPAFVAGSQKVWLGIAVGVFGAVMGAAVL